MKKLNITKERFEKSRYFTNKYGKLEYVSESGKLFKTNKGQILMFNEGVFGDIGDAIDSGISGVRKFFRGKPKFKEGDTVMLCMIEWNPCSVCHGGTIVDNKWGDNKWYYKVDFDDDSDISWWPEDALAVDSDPEAKNEKLDKKTLIKKYPEFVKRAKTILGKKTRKELGIDESTKKFGRKSVKESTGDVSTDPAYVCPYCGGRNCEFVDAEDYPQDGYFDGAELLSCFKCNDCDKNYSVVFRLSVDDVVNADPGRYNNDECPPSGYYGPTH